MKIRDIMTPHPEVLTVHDYVGHAARVMKAADIDLIPIVDDLSNMRLAGVITDRDIALRCIGDQRGPYVRIDEVMTTGDLACVRATDDVQAVMRSTEHGRMGRIPVVDDHYRLIGVVAQADVARRMGPREPQAMEHTLEAIAEPVIQ